jgi:hypothetical protein
MSRRLAIVAKGAPVNGSMWLFRLSGCPIPAHPEGSPHLPDPFRVIRVIRSFGCSAVPLLNPDF